MDEKAIHSFLESLANKLQAPEELANIEPGYIPEELLAIVRQSGSAQKFR